MNDERVGAVTVRATCPVVEFPAAVIVAGVSVATATVVTVAVPVVAPDGIVIVAGTEAAADALDVSVTGYPVGGAALEIVTVTVAVVPPTTEAELTATVLIVGAFTVKAAPALAIPIAAPMLATVVVASWEVVTVKVAVLLPAAIETVAGTLATALSELRLTVTPPAGA